MVAREGWGEESKQVSEVKRNFQLQKQQFMAIKCTM